MHLQSEIIVPQNIEQVSKFFYEPSNFAKWDRSVAETIQTSADGAAESTFDTIAPSGMRMSYKVIELEYGKNAKILLTESKMFKEAIWQFLFDVAEGGTRITCHVNFKVRAKYFFLGPVLYLTRKALFRDLTFLKIALDENCVE